MQRINIDPVLSKLSPIQVEAGSIQINKGFSFLGFFKWKANARHPHSPCDPCGLTASLRDQNLRQAQRLVPSWAAHFFLSVGGVDPGTPHAVTLPAAGCLGPARRAEPCPGDTVPAQPGDRSLPDGLRPQTNGSPVRNAGLVVPSHRLDDFDEGVLPSPEAAVCLQGTQRGEGGLWLQSHRPRLGGQLVQARAPDARVAPVRWAAHGPGEAATW